MAGLKEEAEAIFEDAEILVSYLNENEDAMETKNYVKDAGSKAILVPETFRGNASPRDRG